MKQLLTLALITVLTFTGCQGKDSVDEATAPVEATVEQVLEDIVTDKAMETSETVEEVKVTGNYTFGKYQITLPNEWVELDVTVDEDLNIWSLNSENGIVLQVSVVANKDKEINKESIKEEVELDSYLSLIEEIENKLENGTQFYGAFIEDHATESQFFYNLAKVDSEVISIIFNKDKSYTNVDIELMNGIIRSFKINQ